MEYVDSQDIDRKELYDIFDDEEITLYMYKILKALDYAHSQGIFHRDMKPGNVMINPETRDLKIIDWGLAGFFMMDKEYTLHTGTRIYICPEMLTGMTNYDYAIDMFSLSVIFAGMIFNIEHFFESRINDYDMMKKHT